MKALLLAILMTACLFARSQEAKPRFGQAVRSPEVSADRRITFRFKAPNALAVSVQREDGPKLAMTKDGSGVWSVTSEPMQPDYYVYSFVVDGVQMADPANPLTKSTITGGAENLVLVRGPQAMPWEDGPVPHGVLHLHTYQSKLFGETRRLIVYTPPGYVASRRYPVLYLLHGVMEDETAWVSAGRLNAIMDNLIARKTALPMIVVCPLGYGLANPPESVGQILTGSIDLKKEMDLFDESLKDEVMLMVERSYRTSKGPQSRAIAGVSMGGAHAAYAGLNHPDRFSWVGSFSGAYVMYGGRLGAFFPDPMPKAKPQLFWSSCGTDDFLLGSFRKTNDWLGKKVPVTVIETPGSHSWTVWRRNLIEFASRIFKVRSRQGVEN